MNWTPDEREARQAKGVQAWNDWMTKHHDRLVLPGGPLGRTKGVSSEGVDDAKNNLVGFVVIEAQSHDEAAALFADHPHFSILPGEGVEVMECLSVPGTD